MTRGCAAEQQVSDIGAGDQQQQPDAGQEHGQRRSNPFGYLLGKGDRDNSLVLVVFRVEPGEVRRHDVQICLRLIQAHTSLDPSESLQRVRTALQFLHVEYVKTQAAQIDQMMNQEIILAKLCTAFALLALLIACVGLYGTMTYAVARRTSEIGIRMALGAQRRAVVWMVLRQAFVLAMAGLTMGVPITVGTAKLIESFLFEVKPNSPAFVAGAGITLLCAVLLAGYVPAWKASRIDPMSAVRHE